MIDEIELLGRLARLERQITSLLSRLGSGENVSPCSQLIAAIVAEDLHQSPFVSSEIVAYANSAPGAYLLKATLHQEGAETSVKLGKKLRQLEGRVVGTWVVRRTGRVGEGILWKVEKYVGDRAPTSTP